METPQRFPEKLAEFGSKRSLYIFRKMPDSFLDVIDAFMYNELTMGIIQACKFEGDSKGCRATKVFRLLQSFPGKDDVIHPYFIRFKYFKKS